MYVGAVKLAVIAVELLGDTDDNVGTLGTYDWFTVTVSVSKAPTLVLGNCLTCPGQTIRTAPLPPSPVNGDAPPAPTTTG
jgi:hypothetical protein